ncbi:hypothetical protein SAMN04488564_101839 [Lentzea waywayandensis]|uniref:Uncharacterized protein n=1 Tax=Lentzea waywayandensis TaxID=84724 RepID=A0A1I6D201_9PSEU|nr:hypothetical protein [Lentzea waywayandensis]SFQ99362.1 hypothetical protein SAMN04488564_101839 [Lentzea waywayandensis]
MTETVSGRAAGLAGFATAFLLLVFTFVAFQNDALKSLGWQGGEYAYAFIFVALGSAVLGVVLKAVAPAPWRSAGTGLILAGTLGVVVVVALIIAFVYALSNLSVP